MRVLVTTTAFPVPSQTFVVDSLRALVLAGFETFLYPAVRYKNAEESLPAGVRMVERSAPRSRSLVEKSLQRIRRAVAHQNWTDERAHLPKLQKTLDVVKPDVILAHFGPAGVLACLASRAEIPVVTNFHGFDVFDSRETEGSNAYTPVERFGSRLICHSHYLRRQVERFSDLPIDVFPPAIDGDSIPRRRGSWKSPARGLFVGRLHRHKGAHTAIRALARQTAAAAHPWSLDVIGDGPDLAMLRELATDLDVNFFGARDSSFVQQQLTRSDFLVVPSEPSRFGGEEGFGRIVVEAQLAGLPVVAAHSGALPSVVGPEDYLHRVADPSSLSQCIDSLLRDAKPERYCERSDVIRGRYSLSRAADDYGASLRAAIEGSAQ